jgi:hypothetical protein
LIIATNDRVHTNRFHYRGGLPVDWRPDLSYGLIEVEMASGTRLRTSGAVDAAVVSAVLVACRD